MRRKAILILVTSFVILGTLLACNAAPGSLNPTAVDLIQSTDTAAPATPVIIPVSPSATATVTKNSSPVPSSTQRITSTVTPKPTSTTTIRPSATDRPTPSYGCNRIPDPRVERSADGQGGILLSGDFVLCELPGKLTFDLDKGVLGVKDVLPLFEWKSNHYQSETDIALDHMFSQIDRTVTYLIEPINGASIYRPGTASISLGDCQAAIASKDSKSFLEGEIGTEACLVTGEGHIAIIRVEQIETYGFGSIELSFTTFNQVMKK